MLSARIQKGAAKLRRIFCYCLLLIYKIADRGENYYCRYIVSINIIVVALYLAIAVR